MLGHEKVADLDVRLKVFNAKVSRLKEELQQQLEKLNQQVMQLFEKRHRKRQFVCKMCTDTGKQPNKLDKGNGFLIDTCSHRICRKHARHFIRKQFKASNFPLKCPVCQGAEITLESARSVFRADEATALETAFKRASNFRCDLCPGQEHFVDQHVLTVACQHRVCRGKLSEHLITKGNEFAFPLMCPVCGIGEISFEEAANVLTPQQMATLEDRYAESLQRSYMFSCDVCLNDEVLTEDLFSPRACGHKVCRNCARQHVRTQYDAALFPLTCPSCIEELTLDEAESVLDVQEIGRLRKMAYEKAVADTVHCSQPNCPGVAEVVPPNTEFTCPVCGYRKCSLCSEPWHGKLTCQEAAQRNLHISEMEKKAEEDFKAFVASERLQQCPTCHAVISKISGCNHVVCIKCRTGFCCRKIIPVANHGNQEVWGADGHKCPLWHN